MKIKIKDGSHYWALFNEKLLIVLYTGNQYEVCGAWECGVPAEGLTIISEIKRPRNNKHTKLLYAYS